MGSGRRLPFKEALTVSVSVLLTVAIAEGVLRVFMPIPYVRVGDTDSLRAPNVARYGWGYAPGAMIAQRHPDSGEVFGVTANSGGWKDVEHAAAKGDVTRILALGDSNTFGLVPLEHTYHRVLERLLYDAGFEVEVIAMAYGAWGTDQALLALEDAGLDAEPDIVISQFDTTDLTDNLADQGLAVLKPLRFRIEDDRLERVPVERALPEPPGILDRSHVVFYTKAAWARAAGWWSDDDTKAHRYDWEAYPQDPTDPLFAHHASPTGTPALEHAWQLYERLLAEMKRLTDANGAVLCLFNECEQGHLEWEVSWGRIRQDTDGEYVMWNGERHDILYERHAVKLAEIAARLDVPLVPNRRPYPRFRHDPHPNEPGNARMAEDLFDFLMSDPRTRSLLDRHRRDPS